MSLPNRKRQRSTDLIGPLLSRVIVEEPHNQDNALNLSHLVHITDDPAHAEMVSRHPRVHELLNVCWSFIGMQEPDLLTAHDEAISILVNLLAPQEQRSKVLRTFVELVQKNQSCRSLLVHDDMPIIAHHIIKSVSKCGNVAPRDVAQACSLTSSSMENPQDRVQFCEALVPQGGDFLLDLLEAWPEDFGIQGLIQTLDRFLSSPVDDLMWSAQKDTRTKFAEAWLKLLTCQLPEGSGALSAQALGNTLQIRDATFIGLLLQGHAMLFQHLITNLVLGLTHNKPETPRLRAAMFTVRQVMERGELVQPLAAHPRFGPLVSITISNLGLATQDDDLLQVLKLLLENDCTKRTVLSGSHLMQIIDSISQLLDSASPHVQDLSLDLLTQTLQSVEPGVILGAQASMTRLLPRLCGYEPAKEHMQSLLTLLQWCPDFVQQVPLDFKRRWLTEKLHQRCHQPQPVLLEVQREHLLDSLCTGLAQCTDSLRLGINVSFKDEDDKEDKEDESDEEESARDRKEFFRLAAAEFMNPDLGLFTSKDGGRSFHLNSAADETNQLQQLQLCGKLIGLALLHGEEVPAMKLSVPLRRMLLGAPLQPLEDMAVIDPEFFEKKVATILEKRYEDEEGDGQRLDDLEFTFVDAADGEELCLGGAERVVTEENKMQYLDLLCHRRLVDSVRAQVDALLSGVNALMPGEVQAQLQRILSASELGLCLCGESSLNVKEWQAKSTMASGTPPEIWDCFWKAAQGMNNAQLHGLLEYATGGCAAEGVESFQLAAASGLVPEAEPSRRTLKLPQYTSPPEMRAALLRTLQ